MNKTKTLTQCLRDIGDEKVEIVLDGGIVVVTKTEALARKMFVLAQGGVEEVVVDGEITQIVHAPDHKVAKSIREWTEGKAAPEPPKEKKKQAKAGQYSSEISRRLSERLGGETKPESEPVVPTRPVIPKGKW